MKTLFRLYIFLLNLLLLANIGCSAITAAGNQGNSPTETAMAPIKTSAPVVNPLPPVAAGTATIPPTATPAAASAQGGACDMPYFPVKAGATWKYRYVAGGLTTDETFNIASVSANGFVRRITFSNISGTSEEQWACTSQGLSNPQMSGLTTTGGGSSTQVRVLSHTGISLPPADTWKVGMSWSESAKLEETIAIGGKSGSSMQVAVDETNKIVGEEKVTVPAGSFTALRVETTFVEHLGKTDLPLASTSWYAQGVGQIKVLAGAGGSTITAELVSFTP